jgi:DNA processing protein
MNALDNEAPIVNENELLFAIALSMHTGFTPSQKLNLLQYFQSAEKVFKYHQSPQNQWPFREAELELNFIQKHSIQCLSVVDKYYPNRLAQIKDPPTLLYLKGSDHFNLPQLISIVGTRQHTQQVKKVVHELLAGLNHLKIGVISGMALGVDGIAHETALHFKMPTWGILANGLDQIYPNQHRRLAIDMLRNNGGLITECPQKTPTLPFQFVKRNRIVAGMSDATIVVESNIEGGSMITANLARGYDREVFAVPGKIHDAKSKGCLWLIKNNIATMYYDPIQLLENMNWPTQSISIPKPIQQLEPIPLSIYLYIQNHGPVHTDQIGAAMNIESGALAGFVLELELKGLIHLLAGNRYSCT